MNSYTWYYIFNKADFIEEGLISKTYSLVLGSLGLKEILVTNGNYLGVTYEGVFLPVQMSDANPFEFESMAVYLDETDQVWLGFLIES